MIQQLLTTANWGKLDYLIVDFPPGTGDIQLTLCQVSPLRCPVLKILTTTASLFSPPDHSRCSIKSRPRYPMSDDYFSEAPLFAAQTVQFSAAVIVTTPQKLAFVDVAKGIRMFARMAVPCAAVAENMSYFDGDDGKRYQPFGSGSGDRVKADFGIPSLVRFPILPELSAAGDGARLNA